jgi:hypothetical protein
LLIEKLAGADFSISNQQSAINTLGGDGVAG